jgi:hypothetical protein
MNSFRSGILHKRGISDLQPHNFIGKSIKETPWMRIFEVLHDYHVKNTVLLVAIFALLTDDLMERLPEEPCILSLHADYLNCYMDAIDELASNQKEESEAHIEKDNESEGR